MINEKTPFILYGGDYNPDQWDEEIWLQDMKIFKKAHINVVTMPVFSWAKLQPAEDLYDFDWLNKVIKLVYENGIFVCLATSTAAQPAWMSKRYPEVLPVDVEGRKRTHGGRVNFCPNSKIYQKYALKLAQKLAENFQNHPAIIVWHIGNEYGSYCYCENCNQKFRDWLKEKYGSIVELNKRWNMSFWGHTMYDWNEITTPSNLNNDNKFFQGMALDYKRFMSDSILSCYQLEYNVIKKITPNIPITTNLWGISSNLDLHKWAKSMDVVSWDNYPAMNDKTCNIAMQHDLIRGLKNGKPFMLMEQTPSQQNWQPYNSLKRPGVMRLWSYQAIAHGADTVMFFQLRRSIGACEKYHGAVIEHVGHSDTRVFQECAKLGAELQSLQDELIDAKVKSEVALLIDFDNWSAIELTSGPSVDLDYLKQLNKYYQVFYELNIQVDVINPSDDFSPYKIVVAPVLYMLKENVADNIKDFVKKGGIFITTFFSGIVNENDIVTLGGYPGELRDLLGIWVEEIDALLPDMKNSFVIKEPIGDVRGEYECGLLCDLVHLEGATSLATYGKDFYAGMPVFTKNKFGKGFAYYIASDPEEAFLKDFIKYLGDEEGLNPILDVPAGVEISCRYKNDKIYIFLLNHNDYKVDLNLKDKKYFELIGKCFHQKNIILDSKGVAIIRGTTTDFSL